MRTIGRLVLALTLGAGAMACGDDGGGSDPDAGANPDAGPDGAPDPELKRSGTVAVFEAAVVNPEAQAIGLMGASVTVSFEDPRTGTIRAEDLNGDGKPDSPVGGCAVRVIDPTNPAQVEPTESDEGVVTVTGTGAGDFACAFNADLEDYVCAPTAALAAGAAPATSSITFVDNGDPTKGAILEIEGVDFSAYPTAGMAVTLTGFTVDGTDDASGDSKANEGGFQVIGQGDAVDRLIIVPSEELATEMATQLGGGGATAGVPAGVTATYAFLVGEGPVPAHPGGGTPILYNTFLDDGGSGGADIVINGPVGSTVVDEFKDFPSCAPNGCTVKANGGGISLDTDQVMIGGSPVTPDALDAFPTTARDVTFSCGLSNGVCGDAMGGVLNAFVISGETTDADVSTLNTGLDVVDMPEAVKRRVTFQCSAIGSTSITIPQAAVELILGAGTATPTTRVEIQATLSAGAIVSNGNQEATTNVVVGHGLAGFTTIP